MKLRATKSAAHEAADIAGHPTHSLAKYTAVSVAGGTASGVTTYQVNSHLSKVTGAPAPQISQETGGMPNDTGKNVSEAAKNVRKKYTRRRKGVS